MKETTHLSIPILLKILCLSFLLSSCGEDEPTVPTEAGLILDEVITIDNVDRNYHIYLPSNPAGKELVLLLHGNSGSHNNSLGLEGTKAAQRVWLDIAEANDFILLAPNGSIGIDGRRGWNDCRDDNAGQTISDDFKFISTLLDRMKELYNYDQDKLYVCGISNGGFMTQRLAMEMPERIAAIATIVATLPVNSECSDSSVPVSALYMNGTDDSLIPYEGGEMPSNLGLISSTDESISYWLNRNGTTSDPIIENLEDINTDDGSAVIKHVYKNGRNNTEVALYQIVGGGHTEPSIQERYAAIYLRLVGTQNGDIEMADEVWDFFKGKSK